MGIDTHLKVIEVLKNIPAGSDLGTYRDYLCPLIAKDPHQQERFQELFPQIAHFLEIKDQHKPEVLSSPIRIIPPLSLAPRKRIYRRVGFLLAFLIGAIAYFSYKLIFPAPQGCTDPMALNFNPKATQNNGNCIYPAADTAVIGCFRPQSR